MKTLLAERFDLLFNRVQLPIANFVLEQKVTSCHGQNLVTLTNINFIRMTFRAC